MTSVLPATGSATGLRLLAHHDLGGYGDGMQVLRHGDALAALKWMTNPANLDKAAQLGTVVGEHPQAQDRHPGGGPHEQPGQPHRHRKQGHDRGRQDTGHGERVVEHGQVPAARRGRRGGFAKWFMRDF